MGQLATPEAIRPMLSVRQVAAIVGVSEKTIRREIDRGQLRAIRAGRSVRITGPDFARWLEK